MGEPKRYLSNVQWAKIEPLLPSEWPGPRGGWPKAKNRNVLEAVLWVLRNNTA
jgi:transposase